jgi:hypothetical protein
MSRTSAEIAHDIATFVPENEDWRPMDLLLAELWKAGNPGQAIPELFSVFERFPEEDGAGVIWSVLHALETLPDYETELVRSLARKPSEFGVLMVSRLLNAGTRQVRGVSLVELLRELASKADSPGIRQTADRLAPRAQP